MIEITEQGQGEIEDVEKNAATFVENKKRLVPVEGEQKTREGANKENKVDGLDVSKVAW